MVTTNPAVAGSNSAPVAQAIKDQCYEFGKREGDGTMARADFCDFVTARSKDADITVDGSAEAWAEFQKGAYERPGAELGGPPPTSDEMAQRASDLKHYITLGANAHLDGPELLANARLVLKGMRDSGTAKGLRTWDIMLVWLRKQNASPERALTDQEIETLFREKAKRATDALDRLTSMRNVGLKQLEAYDADAEAAEASGDDTTNGASNGAANGEDSGMSTLEADDLEGGTQRDRLQSALDIIDGLIADYGGTRKDQRKAERARVRAEKEAAKKAAKEAKAAA